MLTENDAKKLEAMVAENNGVDPIAEAHRRMNEMSTEDLKKLVLVAANRLALAMNGGKDYRSNTDAVIAVCHGVQEVFNAYDLAHGHVATPSWGQFSQMPN